MWCDFMDSMFQSPLMLLKSGSMPSIGDGFSEEIAPTFESTKDIDPSVLWVFHAFSMVFSCVFHRFSRVFHRFSMDFHGFRRLFGQARIVQERRGRGTLQTALREKVKQIPDDDVMANESAFRP